jgi:hypothetical protein
LFQSLSWQSSRFQMENLNLLKKDDAQPFLPFSHTLTYVAFVCCRYEVVRPRGCLPLHARCGKNAFLQQPLLYKHDQFTKTGLGHT